MSVKYSLRKLRVIRYFGIKSNLIYIGMNNDSFITESSSLGWIESLCIESSFNEFSLSKYLNGKCLVLINQV